MEAMPCSVSDLNIVGTKKDGIILDHDVKNSFKCIEGCSRNSFLNQEEETSIKLDINKEEWTSQYPLRCGEAAASYYSSQEPGVQSQDIALGVVDKFLLINDMGSSQQINKGSTETVISPPIASVKRAQSSVMKSIKNTVGNAQVYEWNDSLEDGGDLFSRNDFSSYCRGSKQRFSNIPSEVICKGSEIIVDADNKRSNAGAKSRTCQKISRIAHFGTKLKQGQSERDVQKSIGSSKKNHFNEMEEHTNTGSMGQLDKSDVHSIDEGIYDVGPATQMAAEAIQALCHSSPVNSEQNNLQLKSGELARSSTNIRKPINTPTRKRSNTSRESGVMTRSKYKIAVTNSRRTKCSSSGKQSTTSCSFSGKQSATLKTKMVSKDNTVEIAAKMVTESKVDENSKGVISLNSGQSKASTIRKKIENMVDKDLEMPPASVLLDKLPLVNGKSNVGIKQMYTSPVAHRTRHSKASMSMNFNKTLSSYPTEDIGGINFCGHRTVEVENELILDASVVPEVNKNDCNISLKATFNRDFGYSCVSDDFKIERKHVEEAGAFLDKDACREPKRSKNNNYSENQTNDCKMDNHSKSVDANATKDVKLSVQRKKHRVFIRSVADILDTVKRKRRSLSSSRKFESDYLASNDGKVENVSGIRTRSSLLSNILKPYFANNSHFKTELSSKPSDAHTYSVSSVKQVVHCDDFETFKEGGQCRLLPEVVKIYSKTEGSPDATSQPGLVCSPTIGINAVLPVCISQDSSKISAHKSLSRSSISRMVVQLEATNMSPSRRRKDMSTFLICFSKHLCQDIIKQQKKILVRLGIQVVSSSLEATHFVADKFVRTRNMLEAMAMGKLVVTPMWIENCGQASCYIDERKYILRDSKKEKEIGFSMPVSLARASQHPLLQGKRLFITQSTKPNQELISGLVKASGGQVVKRIMPSTTKEDKLSDDLLVISSEEDFEVCEPLLKKGAAIFSSELLLNGIVVQKLEYERHQIFLDQANKR